MTYIEPITPTALKRLQKRERESRAVRVTTALAAHALPCDTGWGCAREEAIAVWGQAKLDHRRWQRELQAALARPCVKGSHVSPAAKARAIRCGRWLDDSEAFKVTK